MKPWCQHFVCNCFSLKVSSQFEVQSQIYIFRQVSATQRPDKYSDRTVPATQNKDQSTTRATQSTLQHACVTQASPGLQKQRDLQAEPSRFTTLRVLCQNKNVKYFNIIKRSGRIRKLASHEPLQLWSHTPHFFSLLQKKINSSGCQKWCTNDGFSAFDIISFLAMLTYWRRG